jgi:GT2 family glycosyltransferase
MGCRARDETRCGGSRKAGNRVRGSPQVGVVTVTYNSERHLNDFFASVEKQSGLDVRVYVVDNAYPDRSLELVREAQQRPGVTINVIANDRNLGVAAGNNLGIKAALRDGADWVLLLNNDTLFDQGFIHNLVAAASASGVPLLAPVIANDDGTLWYGGGHVVPWQGYRVVHEGMYVALAADRTIHEAVEPTGYASTCCLLVRTDVFTRVGYMDESYFVYGDDTDFAIRCHQAGLTFSVTSQARLVHKQEGSTGGDQSPFHATWLTRNWVLVARRYRPGWRRVLALMYIYVWSIGRFLLRRDTSATFRLRLSAIRKGMAVDVHDHRIPQSVP